MPEVAEGGRGGTVSGSGSGSTPKWSKMAQKWGVFLGGISRLPGPQDPPPVKKKCKTRKQNFAASAKSRFLRRNSSSKIFLPLHLYLSNPPHKKRGGKDARTAIMISSSSRGVSIATGNGNFARCYPLPLPWQPRET